MALCATGFNQAGTLRVLIIPAVALCSVLAVLARVLRSVEKRSRAGVIIWAFALLSITGLLARFHSLLAR